MRWHSPCITPPPPGGPGPPPPTPPPPRPARRAIRLPSPRRRDLPRRQMTADLFDSADVLPAREPIGEGALLLRGFARAIQHDLLNAVRGVSEQAPFRRMFTPGGHQMS